MSDAELKPKPEEGGSMLPSLLAGAGILVVAALMIFVPDDGAKPEKKDSADGATAKFEKGKGSSRGGVQGREADDAKRAPNGKEIRINPRIQAATEFGMSKDPPQPPPSFDDADDEIEFWTMQLSEAERVLKMREKAIDRLPAIKEQIANGNDPEGGLKAFEKREQVINENLSKQQDKVAELKEKLAAIKDLNEG